MNVTDDSIELNGTAPSAKDRDEAKRIAQSFAGNRKVVDNLKVSGSGGAADQSSTGNVGSSDSSDSTTGTSSTPSTTSPNPESPTVPK